MKLLFHSQDLPIHHFSKQITLSDDESIDEIVDKGITDMGQTFERKCSLSEHF